MHMISISERIRQTVREIISNLTSISIRKDKKLEILSEKILSEKRVEDLLKEQKKDGKIIDFLSRSNGCFKFRRRRIDADFLIILVKGSIHMPMFLKVRIYQAGADKYLEKQKLKEERWYKEDEEDKDDFVEVPVLIAGPQRTASQIKQDWQKILEQTIKES